MGAKRSRRSRSYGIDKDRYGTARPQRIRSVLPIIAVFCDDTKTAPSYFAHIKREVKERVSLIIHPKSCDRADAHRVVAQAIDCLRRLANRQTTDSNDQSFVWALLDLEASVEARGIASSAATTARNAGVFVALSDPCYEVWTLSHLCDTGESFASCSSVLQRIKSEWLKRFSVPFGPKAQAGYLTLMPFREIATERARRHCLAKDPSYSEVYKLVELIEQLAKK
jgi:hypothetical protein